MAEDDSRLGSVRRRTFQEIAADGMELPLVKARTQALEATKKEEARKKAEVPLGTWPEDLRGCPNVVLRSALFSAGQPRKERKLHRDRQLPAAIGTRSIAYTGPQLYQHELDVLLEVYHRCREAPAGTTTTFQPYGLLRTLRRADGKANCVQLLSTMGLLQATSIKVVPEDPKQDGYLGQLIRDVRFNQELSRWEVGVLPEIVALFAPEEHTWLHFAARLDLGKNYLGKWLHGYFSSHRKPHPISVRRLKELCGSETDARPRRFRETLRAALLEVERVESKYRRRFQWRIDDQDLVHVLRERGN